MATNLVNATRELMDKTWRSMVTYGSPLLTRLLERGNIVPGGLYYEQIYESATMTSLVQEYGPNDPLNGGSKEIMAKPHWHVAFLQCPVEENVDERIMNAPRTDAQLIKIRDKIAEGAVKAIKYKLLDRIYGCAVDNEIDGNHTYVQGLPSALMYAQSATAYDGSNYGGLERTTADYTEFQAADAANWAEDKSFNKENLDKYIDACAEYDSEAGTYLILVGPTLYRVMKGVFEGQNMYVQKGMVAKQGFDSMEYGGIEIAKDHRLDRITTTTTLHNGSKIGPSASGSTSAGLCGDATYNGSSAYVGTSFMFVLNLDTWHLRYWQDPEGSGPFEMGDFFAQDNVEGGVEKKLARVKWKGNLTCDAPNRNLMRANLS